MDEYSIAKQKLLSAALAAAHGQISRECQDPGPYDDAQAELEDEMLRDATLKFMTTWGDTNQDQESTDG